MKKTLANGLIFIGLITCLFGYKGKDTSLEDAKEIYFNKIIDKTTIDFKLPKGWNYEELPLEEGDKLSLKIYDESSNKYMTLYYLDNPVGVCGTGRTSKDVTISNNKIAIMGYYDGKKQWDDIIFPNTAPNVIFINENLEDEDTIEILKTITISQAD
ncbi:MAG: hypothetical protein OSJ70_09995 [Bacilli bacterium]|nr:hypothetical protein [Bacilli bacterium]